MNPDIINALFETFGGVVILLNIFRIYKDKEVKGFHWLVLFFFTSWGYWNLWYYPYLNQWFSFFGGIGVVTTNTVYLGMVLYYMRKSVIENPLKVYEGLDKENKPL